MTQPANKRLVTEAKLTTYSASRWQANHAYTAGDTVLAPDGSLVKAKATFTSGGSYSATNWTTVGATTGTQAKTEMDAVYIPLTQKGTANGVLGLDGSGLVPVSQLPVSTAPVLRATTGAPTVLATDILGDFAFDVAAKILYGPLTGTPVVGQPWINAGISSATSTNLDISTAVAGEATARQTAINTAISNLVAGAPAALDTLLELANQLATDESVVTTLTSTVGGKLAKASNLSDLASAATARTNLGLGSAATSNTGDFDATGAASAAQAFAIQRANHTGTQAVGTITGLAAVATSGAKADVGLSNVDNTSDVNKPVSTAQRAALDLKDPTRLVTPFNPLLATGPSGMLATNGGRGCRVIVPRSGQLRDLGVYINTQSGNIDVAVYDTGNASSTVRTRLWSTGSIACPAAGWAIVGDPNIAVVEGQQLDLVISADNGTVSIQRYSSNIAGTNQLPSAYWAVTGAALPKLGYTAPTVFPLPTTMAEASLTVAQVTPLLIGRIS